MKAIIRSSRTPRRGRHSAGILPVPVRPRDWDASQRAEATRLGTRRLGWLVLYGPYFRRFYAFAAWYASAPVLVEADTVEALEDRMDGVERESAFRDPAAHARIARLLRGSAA